MRLLLRGIVALALAAPAGRPERLTAQRLDLSRFQMVDLTHPLNAGTWFWPTSPSGFELKQLAKGPTPGGWFYSAYAFSAPEHGGTHLDAPIHFSATGLTADQIPLGQLVAPAVVLDVSTQAARDRDYRLTVSDVEAFERRHGRIAPGAMVLLRTGWDRFWSTRKEYFGDDTPGDASHLHFPSYGGEAARLLVEQRRVVALGADVASIDYGASTDFPVHRTAAARNVIGLENLRGLDQLPPSGPWCWRFP